MDHASLYDYHRQDAKDGRDGKERHDELDTSAGTLIPAPFVVLGAPATAGKLGALVAAATLAVKAVCPAGA